MSLAVRLVLAVLLALPATAASVVAQDGGAGTPRPDQLAVRRARAHYEAGEMREARTILEPLVKLKGAAADTFSLWGLVHMEPPFDRPDVAAAAFADALRRDGEHVEALYGMAILSCRRDDWGRAAELIARCLAAAPEHGPARFQKGFIAMQRGRLDEAEEAFGAVADRMIDAAEFLAIIASRRGRNAEAAERMAEVVARTPEDAAGRPRLQFQLGQMLLAVSRKDEARAAFEAAVAAGFPAIEARLALADDAVARDDDEAARTWWTRALEAESFEGPMATARKRADAHVGLGGVALRAGDTVEAQAALEAALALDPHHPSAWYQLGGVLRRSGRVEEARRALERHGELQKLHDRLRSLEATVLERPEDAVLRREAGRIAAALGRHDRAWKALEAAMTLQPDLPGVLELMVIVSRGLGREDVAGAIERKLAEDAPTTRPGDEAPDGEPAR